jgi:hypothetical protein
VKREADFLFAIITKSPLFSKTKILLTQIRKAFAFSGIGEREKRFAPLPKA